MTLSLSPRPLTHATSSHSHFAAFRSLCLPFRTLPCLTNMLLRSGRPGGRPLAGSQRARLSGKYRFVGNPMFCAFYFPPGDRKRDTDTIFEFVSEQLDKRGHRCLLHLCCDANAHVGLSRGPPKVRTTSAAVGGQNAALGNYQGYVLRHCAERHHMVLSNTFFSNPPTFYGVTGNTPFCAHVPSCPTSRPVRYGGEQVTLYNAITDHNTSTAGLAKVHPGHRDTFGIRIRPSPLQLNVSIAALSSTTWKLSSSAVFPTPHPFWTSMLSTNGYRAPYARLLSTTPPHQLKKRGRDPQYDAATAHRAHCCRDLRTLVTCMLKPGRCVVLARVSLKAGNRGRSFKRAQRRDLAHARLTEMQETWERGDFGRIPEERFASS